MSEHHEIIVDILGAVPDWCEGEIVRCRDCKYCMAYIAGAYCDYMAHAIEPDGFCAWAKRKEGGE